MTVKPTPEELMAYADGQLDDAHAQRVEHAIAAFPELRAAVDDHRRTRAAAREAFDEMAKAPMSPGLAALSNSLAAPRSPAAWASNPRSAGKWRKQFAVGAWPAAAAACLFGGVISGALLTASNDDVIRWRGGPSAGSMLAQVLEKSPSETASARGEGQAIVVASFTSGDGRFCRQFEIGGAADGVACRGADGWSILALAKRPGGAGSFGTAGGEDPVGLAVAGLDPGPRIEGEAEQRLIDRGWKN
ncbi:MAG: hypothetical protein Q8R02_23840 [Hyphomonadaceae bacterium]|nr:hypothetical protein [Hyphomonadaceae bacterium]